ncbi:MAG: lamin tail domain-containing protein [Candidatus Falkowbacteria bacterium]
MITLIGSTIKKTAGLIALLGFLFLLFNYQDLAEAVSTTWLINKVQISGGDGKTDADLIQLYNASSEPLNLKGLRLIKRTKTGASDTTLKSWTADTMVAPGAYYSWANSQYGAELGADITTSGSLAADNCAALRQGSENTGAIIDAVGWGECLSLAENTPTCNPAGATPVQRLNLTDTDNNAVDFSCGAAVAATTENPPAQTATPTSGGGSFIPTINLNGQLFINEIYPSPANGDKEWIEFYNSGSSISLEGLYLEDSSGSKHKLSGEMNNYLLIEAPKCSLNNDGDTIYLKDANGHYLDVLAYGKNSALPAPTAGQSLARLPDGTGTWLLTATPTKGNANLVTAPTAEEDNPKTAESKSKLIISEVLPDPLGADLEHQNQEYIELYNSGDTPINLNGWLIHVDKAQLYKISSSTPLAAGAYLSITRRQSKLGLNNSGGLIEIFEPAHSTANTSLRYSNGTEGQAYAWHQSDFSQNSWSWTMTPTPGLANQINKINLAPVIIWDCPGQAGQIWLDASDSYDPEGLTLDFAWQIDNRFFTIQPALDYYLDNTSHQIILTISDGHLSSTKKCQIKGTSKTITPAKPTKKIAPKITTPKKVTAQTTTIKKATPKIKVSTAPTSKKTITASRQLWRGQVASLPGEYGNQYFYLLPEGEDQAKQIYAYNKDFPKLKIGQLLEVSGELSTQIAPQRLKIKKASDIKIIKDGRLPAPAELDLADLGEDSLGTFVKISGTVTIKRGSLVYLDDGTGEGSLTLPKNMAKNSLKKGDQLGAIGLVKASQNTITVALRSQADLEVKTSPASTTSTLAAIPPIKTGNSKYLYTGIALICLILGILLWKAVALNTSHNQGIDKSAKM